MTLLQIHARTHTDRKTHTHTHKHTANERGPDVPCMHTVIMYNTGVLEFNYSIQDQLIAQLSDKL